LPDEQKSDTKAQQEDKSTESKIGILSDIYFVFMENVFVTAS